MLSLVADSNSADAGVNVELSQYGGCLVPGKGHCGYLTLPPLEKDMGEKFLNPAIM